MINIKNFNASLLKINKKSYKNIDIYYIEYIPEKDSKFLNIRSVNPLYFIVDKVDGFIEEKKGNRYINFASTDNNKKVLKKYTELWDGIKTLIEKSLYVCNGCHDLSMVVFDLNDLMISNIKGVDYRCFVFKMSKYDAIKLLNNSLLDNKGIL